MVACAHPRPSSRPSDVHDALGTQLVAWDVVRRHAEVKLVTISLPSIALHEGPSVDDGSPMVTMVELARLSPHFSAVVATWPTICERRGALPNDVFDYAMAWCQFARDGKGDLESILIRLMSSTVLGLRTAALDDLLNVIADAHDAATAIRILAKTTAPADALYKLAALYSSLGREDDADAVRTHLPPPPPSQTGCKQLNDALETFVPSSLATIRVVAAGSSNCAALARSLVCRIASVSNVFGDTGCTAPSGLPVGERQLREAHYLAAYAEWGGDWTAVIEHAEKAMPEPGAEQVAIAALSSSVRSGCAPAGLREVHEHAETLLRDPSHDARWSPTLRAFAALTPKNCEGLQTAPAAR
jgi:hypothetical protein